jgi:hypothetical protein
MTDNAQFFEEPQTEPTEEKKKNITLGIYQRLRLGEWVKARASSPSTYAQLAKLASAELGFTVTPSHIEGMWRGINGKRKFDKPTTPPLPEIPAGMVLVECREMVLLRENLAEARAEAHELAQRVLRLKENGENYAQLLESKLHPEGMVLVAATEIEQLRAIKVKHEKIVEQTRDFLNVTGAQLNKIRWEIFNAN